MAITKNTADLLAQAAATLPDNTTQQISPQDTREMSENIAQSSYNKVSDSALVGLKNHSTIPVYESGQGTVNGGDIYISNKVTGPGAFVVADWDIQSGVSPGDQAKIDFISITQAVDLDQLETDTATNTGKVSADGSVTTHNDVSNAGSGLIITSGERTTLGTAEQTANKGAVNGYASLDGGGKVPASELPSYVDDVIEVANFAALPVTGETGKIYVTIDDGKIFRWTGSVYVEISADAGAPVTSVNTLIGAVVLDADDVSDAATTNKYTTAGDITKMGHISVTQAVNLDTIESDTATNNAKVSDINHNVTTNLSEGTSTTTTVAVNSSDGTPATLLAATTIRAGVMTSGKFDEVVLNNAKVTNVSTDLSEGTSTTTTVDVNSSDGTNATLAAASTIRAGVMTSGKFDEVVLNNAKVSADGSVDTHSDVDTTTTAPVVGDALVWDGSNWINSDVFLATGATPAASLRLHQELLSGVGRLTWEGLTGGLFTIIDDKDNELWTVSDVSGNPVGYIDADWNVRLGNPFNRPVDISYDSGTGVSSTVLKGKLGTFGATPVVQPTTGGIAAVIAAGSGTNALQDDTYDGYTIAEIVGALRNLGILA